MEQEFGPDRILWVDEHVAEQLSNPDVRERAAWYGVSGVPDIRIDGSRRVSGFSTCEEYANHLRSAIEARLAETGGVSPVEIQGRTFIGDSVMIRSSFTLVDPVELVDLHATFFIVEDDVIIDPGGDPWPRVVRDIYEQPITLTDPGDIAVVDVDLPIDPNGDFIPWNPDRLYVLAFLQRVSGDKAIIQGAVLPGGAVAHVPLPVRSIPEGNGAVEFEGFVWNDQELPDTITIDPRESFGDWPVEVQAGDDPAWQVPPVELIVAPADTAAFRMRVHTGAGLELRSGAARINSQLLRVYQEVDLEVFNGAWSLLLVDDDYDTHYDDEAAIEEGILAAGLLRDIWHVADDPRGAPSAEELRTYDLVLWQTGRYPVSDPAPLTPEDMEALKDYIDGGGGMLLTSQQYLDHWELDREFTATYLGVALRMLNLGYMKMTGVASDPIGDRMDLDLTIAPPVNKADGAVPGATATAFLFSEAGDPAGLRNELPAGPRVVFLPWALHALEAEPNPDNIATLVRRSAEWLMRQAPSSVEATEAFVGGSRINSLRPNPARDRVEIDFHLSGEDATHPIRLEIFDLSGRRVAVIAEGVLAAGRQIVTWRAGTSDGAAVESGVYFARLATRSGVSATKLILL